MVLSAPKLQTPRSIARASSQKAFARHPSARPAWASPSPPTVFRLKRIRPRAEPPTKNAMMPSKGHVNQLKIPITRAQTAPASVGATPTGA
jgi:hypothetical protein